MVQWKGNWCARMKKQKWNEMRANRSAAPLQKRGPHFYDTINKRRQLLEWKRIEDIDCTHTSILYNASKLVKKKKITFGMKTMQGMQGLVSIATDISPPRLSFPHSSLAPLLSFCSFPISLFYSLLHSSTLRLPPPLHPSVTSSLPVPPFPHPPAPIPLLLCLLCVAGLVSGQQAMPRWPRCVSGQSGVWDGMCWVAGEGHSDGVARAPLHLFHAVEVLRAGGEEGDSSWRGRKGGDYLGRERRK